MRRLLIGDIHATLPAFEAVLAAAGRVDEIVCLGDVVGYGPHPAECVELLISLDATSVIGNHDAEVLYEPQYDLSSARSPHHYWLRWTYEQLTPTHREFLAGLPVSVLLDDPDLGPIHVVHSVGDARLHHGMDDEAVAAAVAEAPARTVLCGHSHRAIDRTVAGRRLICLPGVGQFRDGPVVALLDMIEQAQRGHRLARADRAVKVQRPRGLTGHEPPEHQPQVWMDQGQAAGDARLGSYVRLTGHWQKAAARRGLIGPTRLCVLGC